MGRTVFLVGEPGSGKSVRLLRFASLYAVRAGIVTIVREDTRFARRLDTGEEIPIAQRRAPVEGDPTPRWVFDDAAMAAVEPAFRAPGATLIVDEIGPLELVAGKGWMAAIAQIGRRPITLAALRPSLFSVAKSRWPEAEFRYIDRR